MKEIETTPYWVNSAGLAATVGGEPPRLAIVPCPVGGRHLAAALHSLRAQGIETLVSLLTAEESRVLGLEDEGQLCRDAGIEYSGFPVTDHSIPDSMENFHTVVARLHRDLRAGKGVGAHCFAGIGRSCMLMACLLCREGLTSDEAFVRLSASPRAAGARHVAAESVGPPLCRILPGRFSEEKRRTVLKPSFGSRLRLIAG